jgi:hypothetical protein
MYCLVNVRFFSVVNLFRNMEKRHIKKSLISIEMGDHSWAIRGLGESSV